MTSASLRWLCADQLGPHFDDGGPIVIAEVVSPFRRRRYHRQKAHLILSALRHRVRELGDRVDYRQGESYRQVLGGSPLSVVNPTSYGLRAVVGILAESAPVEVLPSRGFVTSEEDFATWAATKTGKRLLMDTFYREQRTASGILMSTASGGKVEPLGGKFSFDHENREQAPKNQSMLGVVEPWFPVEDEIDAEVREYLDALEKRGDAVFVGDDGPRLFPATRGEAVQALEHFVEHRLATFGPHEDAALREDWAMSHSLLSPAMNLGLLDPREVIDAAVEKYHRGGVPLASVEGFVRQIMGWRDWVWHLYWHRGQDFVDSNFLGHQEPLPESFVDLRADLVDSRCLSTVLAEVRERGWTHHINRLMVLGSWALQRGVNPKVLNDWFVDVFVDGTPWVMPANVVGMSQYGDGGGVATKPYTSGGSYVSKMTNYCTECPFKPTVRIGPEACPLTAGYWVFLARAEPQLRSNHRMAQPLAGMRRLIDIEQVVSQETQRTSW